MKTIFYCLACLAGTGLCLYGQEPPEPYCEPGYKLVKEVQIKEVEKWQCKLVPYVRKTRKWVYESKEFPFCIHKSGRLGFSGCLPCWIPDPMCMGPYRRNLLVKKQIVVKEEQATRCVVEKVVEKVPCIIYRKVPLDQKNPPTTRRSLPSSPYGPSRNIQGVRYANPVKSE